MATFLTPVNVTPGTAGAWTDVDVSAHVPSGAAGVILLIYNVDTVSAYNVGLRKNGSTDNRVRDIRWNYHASAVIGVDASRVFEANVENTTNLELWLVGYFTNDEAVFFDNGADKSTPTTNSYVDVDISTDSGGDTALAAVVEVSASASTYGWYLRKNGSTDNRYGTSHRNMQSWNIVGVDASEIFEQKIENANVDIFLVGYLTDSIVYHTNGTDRSTGTTGAYEDVDALPSGAVGGVYEFHVVSGSVRSGALRKNGSSDDFYRKVAEDGATGHFYVECDGSRIVEQKIETTDVDLFEIGYFEASPTSAGETVVGAGGASASGSVGSVTATGGALVQPTGLSATGDVGTVTVGIVETVSATGVSASGAVGTPTVTGGALVELAGVSATGSLGSVTVAAGALVQPSGVSATGQVGTVTTAFDMAFAVSGVSGTGDVGTVTVSGVGDATADATGVSASGSVGSVTVAADHVLSVSGVSAEGQIGTVTATGGATVAVSGAAADGEVGVATVISGEVASVSGVSAAGQVGAVTITTGALAALAGVQAVGRIGNVGVLFDATVSVTGLSAAGSVGTVIVQTGVAIARGPITPAIARGPITPAIPRA